MLALHVAFVVLLAGTEAFFTGLAVLNLRHAGAAVDDAGEWFDDLDVDPDRLLDYNRLKTALGRLEAWTGLATLLLVLYSGLLADAVRALEATGWPFLVRGVAFFLGAVVVARLWSVPFDAVDTFGIEEAFDFNRQSPRLFARDLAVGLAVTLAFTAPLGGAVLWLIAAFPTWWWVGAWAVFVAFSVAMLVLYPRVIAPLFNDFEPVEEGDLRRAVEDVFERAGFTCEGIYEMDASRRSSHSNAYFVGFGPAKRVVLFDTLIERMDHEELQSVLAHELAHWKRAHIWKRIAGSALRTGVVLAVLAFLLSTDWLYAMFGLPTDAVYAGLAVAGLWVQPLERLSSPVENRLAIAHEREADAFAVEVMDDGEPLVAALSRLTGENLSNPFPHPAYAAFHYTHPPVPDRIRHIRDRAEASEGAAG